MRNERWIQRQESLESTCIISSQIFLLKEQRNTVKAELKLEKNNRKQNTHKLLLFQSVSKLFSLLANTEIGGQSSCIKIVPWEDISFDLFSFICYWQNIFVVSKEQLRNSLKNLSHPQLVGSTCPPVFSLSFL